MVSNLPTLLAENSEHATSGTIDSVDTSAHTAAVMAERTPIPSAIRPDVPPRLDALTSLRFFAAAMLVLFHADLFLNKSTHVFQGIALKQGVSFFFVLSGFILFYNYPVLKNATERAKFFIARFARIWPAQAAVIPIILLMVPTSLLGAHGIKLFSIIASGLLMVQSYIPNWRYYLGINAPAWSISTEFFFYLLFPFLIVNWGKTWLPKLCAAAGFTIAAMFAAGYVGSLPFSGENRQLCNYLVYINPFARLFEFELGMLSAYVFRNVRTSFESNIPGINLLQIASLALVALALLLCPLPLHELGKPIPSPLANWVDGSGGCLAFALLVFSMAFSRGLIAKALSHPSLVLLGEISYSMYLLHWVLFMFLSMHLADGSIHVAPWAYLSGFAVTLLGSSYLMYRFVEKPCRRFLSTTLFDVWKKRVAAGPEQESSK